MPEVPVPGLDLHAEVAGRSIDASLTEACAAGALLVTPSGRLSTTVAPARLWVKGRRGPSLDCRFYMGVMFHHVYQRTAVPAGCAACFKIKVAPRTLRELMATYDVARQLAYSYKIGLDEPTPTTAGVYGCYFYLTGLDAARQAYPGIRAAITGHPLLGPDVPVFIKRGCTEYEVHCGPSDQFAFTPQQVAIEHALRAHIDVPPTPSSSHTDVMRAFARWIETAFRLGDETYRDFTGGRRLYPDVVRYDPSPAAAVPPEGPLDPGP